MSYTIRFVTRATCTSKLELHDQPLACVFERLHASPGGVQVDVAAFNQEHGETTEVVLGENDVARQKNPRLEARYEFLSGDVLHACSTREERCGREGGADCFV
mmetsp:Transcript_24239/g.78189  ORF Transcript_24239/g.78189 Transcript_24239/m.78189 type:complete len:103 (-) Transcript_24239:2399-2707(-)